MQLIKRSCYLCAWIWNGKEIAFTTTKYSSYKNSNAAESWKCGDRSNEETFSKILESCEEFNEGILNVLIVEKDTSSETVESIIKSKTIIFNYVLRYFCE